LGSVSRDTATLLVGYFVHNSRIISFSDDCEKVQEIYFALFQLFALPYESSPLIIASIE
jgi:hypothetical protein